MKERKQQIQQQKIKQEQEEIKDNIRLQIQQKQIFDEIAREKGLSQEQALKEYAQMLKNKQENDPTK